MSRASALEISPTVAACSQWIPDRLLVAQVVVVADHHEVAEAMKVTAADLKQLDIIDDVSSSRWAAPIAVRRDDRPRRQGHLGGADPARQSRRRRAAPAPSAQVPGDSFGIVRIVILRKP